MVVTNPAPIESTPIKTGAVPAVTLKLLTGNQVEGGRAAGVFTTDDLINILLYVRSSRMLPDNIDAFKKELGSDSTGIVGLEPVDIIALYKQIKDHANRWTPVEEKVKDQSSSLTNAANAITTTGSEIIEVIDAMPMVQRIRQKVQNSTATITLDEEDKEIQKALPEVITQLRVICLEQQEKSRKVLTAVRDYKTEISGGTLSNNTTVMGLEPTVADKKEKAKKADLGDTIKRLQGEIDALGQRIDELKKDYDKFVGLAFTGAAGGPIGLAITGGIFGDKAERARKERNSKIAEKEAKSRELARDQIVQGILNLYATQFTDLGMRLLDAEQALTHLDFLWTDMVTRIDSSVDEWKKVNDETSLLAFKNNLNLIISPWKEVGNMSTKLVKVFDQAYMDFRKTYGV